MSDDQILRTTMEETKTFSEAWEEATRVRCGTCGRATWRTFAGARIDGEHVAVVWHECRYGHLTEDPFGASRIFAAFDPARV